MPLLDGIIGCWSPSIRGSGYTLPDLSGRGNHGTLTNMDIATAWEPAAVRGVSGRTNRHDGTNDYTTGSPRAIIGLGDMTFASWVLVRSGYGVLCHSNWTAGMLWYVGNIGSGVNQGIYFASSATAALGATAMTYNVWNHVAWCRRGTSLDIFLNGRLDVTRTSNTGPTFANTLDWGGYSGSSEWLPGSIGERLIFNRALTQPEVLEIFRRGNGAIGRELTGQTRRRVFGFVPAAFRAYWARRQNQIIGGGV